ncbi:hypothetical protein HK102_014018 [Quaeritorhiza haematococci]|nr:hypothetical protein HK102_014018 [Quaeritorhiza haematococci]
MLSGTLPFGTDENPMLLARKIQSANYEFDDPKWEYISESAKDLISKLLVVDPDKRLDIEQTLNHPWIAGQKQLLAKLYAKSSLPASTYTAAVTASHAMSAIIKFFDQVLQRLSPSTKKKKRNSASGKPWSRFDEHQVEHPPAISHDPNTADKGKGTADPTDFADASSPVQLLKESQSPSTVKDKDKESLNTASSTKSGKNSHGTVSLWTDRLSHRRSHRDLVRESKTQYASFGAIIRHAVIEGQQNNHNLSFALHILDQSDWERIAKSLLLEVKAVAGQKLFDPDVAARVNTCTSTTTSTTKSIKSIADSEDGPASAAALFGGLSRTSSVETLVLKEAP